MLQKPSIKKLGKHLTYLKRYIDDDMIDPEEKMEAERTGCKPTPSLEVTLACSEEGYAVQIGDNSFTGPAYLHLFWGVGTLTRNTNARDLARELIEQVAELYHA